MTILTKKFHCSTAMKCCLRYRTVLRVRELIECKYSANKITAQL